ncbi:MAG: DUF4291 domain-containing protein [Janthinobacterium lividum]
MLAIHEIRADFDVSTVVIYQAYPKAIAEAALKAGKFVPPFSFGRMTWIKPSFLWMMERSNWGLKTGQEHILAVRLTRAGWEEALSLAVLTHPEKGAYRNEEDWRQQFASASVYVQWDPERTLRGAALDCKSIQVGISRQIIQRYVDEWITGIEDRTPLVRKMQGLIQSGQATKAKGFLPKERVYPVSAETARRLGMKGETT